MFVRKFKEPFYRLVESSEGINRPKIDFLQNPQNELKNSELIKSRNLIISRCVKMQITLEWLCRVIGRLKLSNFDILESLTNSLIFSENIKNKKLFYVSFQKIDINFPTDV